MIDIGVVFYSIRADGGGLDARWHTTRFKADKPGTGHAVGDTSNGFVGRYDITFYRPDGSLAEALELNIQKSGEVYTLSFSSDGHVHFFGVGVEVDGGLATGYRKIE